ncbi:MAG TPA: AAC(3) family N-acetyltransferase [Solirubrobacterales bacterium]|nr:AAC(3) family N-acetyltransferase [Solirubrobacterales bacterium]
MKALLRRLPQPVRDRMRAARKRYRSVRYRLRERFRPTRLGREEIEAAIRSAGVGEGDAVFVQAGMAAFGTIEGGPQTVIDAFEAVVGTDGLIAMPAFPLTGPAIEHLREHPVFDARTMPSRMGAVSERFRTGPRTLRSVHPTHSISARGPGAEEVVAGHELAETPFGEGTPFFVLRERGAKQVFFGAGVRAITMYHSFEVIREPPFPIDVFWPERIPATCIGMDGETTNMTTLVHHPRLAPGRIDVSAAVEAEVKRRLLDGGMRSVELGRGEVLCQPLPAMFETFERMLADGVTIYDPRILEAARARGRGAPA